MFCRKCGAALRDTDCFCSHCGAPVEKEKDQTAEDRGQELPFLRYGQPVPPMPREQIVELAAEESETTGRRQRTRKGDKSAPESLEEQNLEAQNLEAQSAEKRWTEEQSPESMRPEEQLYRDSFLEKKEEKSHALLMTVTILLVIAVVTVAFLIIYFFVNRNSASLENRENNGAEIQIITESSQNAGQNGPAAGETDAGAPSGAEAADGAAAEAADTERITVQTEAASEVQTQAAAKTETDGVLDITQIEQLFVNESSASRYGVYIYDLKNSREYAAGSSEEAMYASALIAVPILYTAAVRLDQGTISLNDQITYVNSIGGRGEAYPEEKDGYDFPLANYLTTMMSYSDNNCMNCLIDFLGLDVINSTCQGAGYTSVDLQRKIVDEVTDGKDNYISARDLAGMVRELYRGKYQTIGSEFIRQYLKIDAGDGYRTVIGLAPELPSDTMFLNQNGRGDTRYNEVAVIADDSCEYIISIMCSGDSGFTYETAVTDISSYVYQSLT